MRNTTRALGAAFGALVLLAPAAIAQGKKEPAPTRLTFGYIDGDERISIEVDGDKVKVLVNGKKMAAERIKRKGAKVSLLDVHRRPVADLRLSKRGGTLHTLSRRPARLRLGITLTPPVAALRSHLRLVDGQTTYVAEVKPSTPAAKSGIHKHDVITLIDGKTPATRVQLGKILETKKPGDVLELTVLRSGETKLFAVELEADDRPTPVTYYGEMLELTEVGYPELLTLGLTRPEVALDLAAPHLVAATDRSHNIPLLLGTIAQINKTQAKTGAKTKTTAKTGRKDLSAQLEDVNARLAKLEKMLEKLTRRVTQRKAH